jgi:RimJ/RimL family protein N-acetyltransferase
MGEYLWRPLTASDADTDFVLRLRSDPRFAPRFYRAARGVTRDGHRRFIEAADERGEINWLIEHGAAGQPVGLASIYHFDPANRRAECGRTVMLDPRAFAPSWVLSAHVAFDRVGVNKLWIETLATNTTIARAVERLGMTREGLLREHVIGGDGRPADVLYFGGTAGDWARIRAARFERWGTPDIISCEGENFR